MVSGKEWNPLTDAGYCLTAELPEEKNSQCQTKNYTKNNFFSRFNWLSEQFKKEDDFYRLLFLLKKKTYSFVD